MILYFFGFFLGIIMLYFGIKLGVKYHKNKYLVVFDLDESEKEFHIPKVGYYSIGLIGGFTAENFSFILKKDGATIEIEEAFPKEMFIKNSTKGKIHYDFYADEIGNYVIKINDLNKLVVWKKFKPSKLDVFSYFEKSVSTENCYVLIKEYAPPFDFIASLLLCLLGFSIFSISTLLYLEKIGLIVIPN